jgi:dTDP-4-amino-4,6-dideoxygalactose transaminase
VASDALNTVDHRPRLVAANDFTRQWAEIRDDAMAAVDRVGASGWLVLGEEVRAFESEFADWWGVPHAVGVASGLDALEISLRCAGLAGARVLTTPLTAFATTLAILRAGAVPVWCDVDESGGLDLDRALAALRADRSIRGVLPVHLYGHPLDPIGLRALVDLEVIVIEDCAQSAGAERGGSPTGLVGVAGATSLYPTKNLGAMGDGGMIFTADAEFATNARTMRDYGQTRRYEHEVIGLNSRLDELHAAVLRSAMLPRLSGWVRRRGEIAERYLAGLDGSALRPIVPAAGASANHLFPVRPSAGDPAEIARRLGAEGVAVSRHYPFVCPDQPAAAGRGEAVDPLDRARRLAADEISLPINPQLSDADVQHVIGACQSISR